MNPTMKCDERSSMTRAELITSFGYECAALHVLEQPAGLVRMIPSADLKETATKEGIAIGADADRTTLIVKIIEYIYADVLELSEGKGDNQPKKKKHKTNHWNW